MVVEVICHGKFNSGVKKKTLNIVKSLLQSQPSCGIIRTTADYFLLPYSWKTKLLETKAFSAHLRRFFAQTKPLAFGRK
jgi:hypothetical protein